MDPSTTLKRLRELDTLLAGEGAHLHTLASQWGVHVKTVRRLLRAIADAGLVVRFSQVGRPRHDGTHYIHFYPDPIERLFSGRESNQP